MSVSVTLKSYFYEVLIPSSQKNTSSPIEDILHHVSISFMKKLALYKCFNPRTHTGCDASIALIRFIYHRFQSTHPHGVRRHKKCTAERLISFNPRTHTGCDLYNDHHRLHVESFNPRTHTGCDAPRAIVHHPQLGFNPRTHTGCDSYVESYKTFLNVSIHAPTRGATIGSQQSGDLHPVSIHAPTRGATDSTRYVLNLDHVSIHAPTRGATDPEHAIRPCLVVSIHAPTRGATLGHGDRYPHGHGFQSTHPHGVRL